MNAFAVAGLALILLTVPLGVATTVRRPLDALVAVELAGVLLVLALVCLAEAFHRSTYFGTAVVAAVACWLGGLVFARFLGRRL